MKTIKSTWPNQNGIKDDNGKRQWHLLPLISIKEVVDVLGFGASLPGRDKDNWKRVDCAKIRFYDAAMRHITDWHEGEQKDEESGYHPLAHAVCCLLFLLWFELTGSKRGGGQ